MMSIGIPLPHDAEAMVHSHHCEKTTTMIQRRPRKESTTHIQPAPPKRTSPSREGRGLQLRWLILFVLLWSLDSNANPIVAAMVSAFHAPSSATATRRCSSLLDRQQRNNNNNNNSGIRRTTASTMLSLSPPQKKAASSQAASAHQYSSRKVASRKTQLRWITQTVQKIQARTDNNSKSKTTTTAESINGTAALTNATSSTITTPTAPNTTTIDSHLLVHALTLLSAARTPQQVLEAGRLLEAADMCGTTTGRHNQQQPVSIQERVVKAAAMTGLLRLALTITEHMLTHNTTTDGGTSESCHLPSEICQDAVCNSLRRAGRIQRLEALLCQFGTVARAQEKQISLVAFNTYLAALCDVATGKDTGIIHQQQQQRGDFLDMEGLDTPLQDDVSNYKTEVLERAWTWIRDPSETERYMAVTPDTVSYATVIQAAAMVGNLTLVDAIWKEFKARNIQPNIVAYNARLRSVSVAVDKNNRFRRDVRQENKKRDQEILAVWDTEIACDPRVTPDKYSIDLLLLPLIRAGRVGDVEALLDMFVKRNSETVVSNAFTAFLLTVVGGSELATARALFETYILPTLSPVMVGDAGGMMRIVRPTTRHFNVLLEGYRKRVHSGYLMQAATDVAKHAAAEEAWALYELMIQSLGARPDAYTITTMMGLCRTSTELSNLLFEAISDHDVDCSSVVLRAALTAFGDLGDASSALWLFSKFSPRSTRTWNVLLGTLAKVAESGASLVVKPTASNAARRFQDSTTIRFSNKEFTYLQQGTTLVQVVRLLLDAMCGNGQINGLNAPTADSQTFCVAASALQYGPTGASLATGIFRNATKLGISADGRFVNAVLRCFGDEIDAALAAWRDEIRPKCLAFEKRARSTPLPPGRSTGKNLVASYNGLLYVCGRALRPDIALRLVYAMNKEGLEPNENSLNSYRSGRRVPKAESTGGFRSSLEQKLKLVDPYESLLFIECTKYDRNDRRRAGDQRVRIIL